jgi:hypothetical protein
MKISKRSSIAMLMLIVASSQLAACASGNNLASTRGVEQAYNSAGVVQMKPYTRTIFDTTNF